MAASLVLLSWAAPAESKMTVEHNPQGTPEFKFPTVPSPLQNDSAARGKFSLLEGQSDSNGSRLRALNDGRLPEDEDQPTQNFFFQAGTDGGWLQLDLGQAIDIKQVNSYSWHSGDRAPQVYTLYATEGAGKDFDPAPKKGTDLEKAGWKQVAKVDTRPASGPVGGQYAVGIAEANHGALGHCRYLLFEISRTEDKDNFGNTFFSEIDVRAMAPSESEIVAGAKVTPVKDFDYSIDVSKAPDLNEWAETRLRPEMDKWYPIIRECLASDGFTAPRKFSVIIQPMRGVAATGDTEVNVSAEWVRSQLQHPEWNEALGSVIHELVHVVQQYKTRGNPGWLVEGIADYVRWFHYEPVAHRPTLRNPAYAKYTDSYKTTAGFLEYVVKNYDHELAVKLNAAMRQGWYHPEVWKDCTGKSVQELWTDYVASVSPGGNSDSVGASSTNAGH